MFTQSNQTVIFVTSDFVARVDLSAGQSITVIESKAAPRAPFTELSDAVRQAFELGSRRRSKVWIVADDFYSGCVELPLDVVNAVTDELIGQTLALEVEYDSGISPFESKMGFLSLHDNKKDERRYWITQAEASQFESVVASVPSWTGPVVGVASSRLIAPIEKNSKAAADSNETKPLVQLTENEIGETAREWLTKAIAAPATIPIIHVAKTELTATQKRRQGMLIAGVAMLMCALHFGTVNQQRLRLVATESQLVSQEQQLRKQVDETERRMRTMQAELTKDQAANDTKTKLIAEQQRRAAEHETNRKFASFLLKSLSTTASDKHNISKIEVENSQTVLSGVAINGHAVASFAKSLDVQLKESVEFASWSVKPPEMSSAGSQSLVTFKLILVSGSIQGLNLTDIRWRGNHAR